jgi:multiple sugar transport system substrate-binding protein
MRAALRSLTRLALLGVVLALAACATELASPGPATSTPDREAQLQASPTSPIPIQTPRPTASPAPTELPISYAPLDCAPTPTLMPSATPICMDCWGDSDVPKGYTVVKWYVGLGTGTALEQIEEEQAVVDAYNAINTEKIYIALNIIPNAEAYNVLATQIAAGTPPEIIGPVGLRGITFASNYGGQDNLLPLDDLIARCHVDLSAYDANTLKPYQNERGEQIALPYAVYPSFIYFNKDLFDAAGLAYPPQQFGALYEGKEWSMEMLRELAMRLTLDEHGVAAGEAGFDPTKIVQFGFVPQWNDSAISEGAFFGAGDLTGPDNGATIPDAWKEAWRWFYRARHMDHFVPDATYTQSEAFGKGNVWKTGKVAMAWTHLWYTCCFEAQDVPNWDIAVVPGYNGTYTAKLHADTFAITKQTKDPEAAFKVYMFLLQNAQLRALYGGLSPIKAEQPAYFAALDKKFAPNTVTWQVVLDSLAYPDLPNHEQSVPNALKFQDRYIAFDELRHKDPGLDLDSEIARFEQDLTAIFQGR